MSAALKTRARRVLEVAVAFAPWTISMFTLYWLEYGEIWSTETEHRGKMSVAILVFGMAMSFLVESYFAKRRRE